MTYAYSFTDHFIILFFPFVLPHSHPVAKTDSKYNGENWLITYPNLGHQFYPSSEWVTGVGPIPQYVLADIYAWLEAHSGLSHPYVPTPTSTVGANPSSYGKS
jgi:hypothetical protein